MDQERIILVTGAARSGKSEWAEFLARNTDKPVIYLATASLDFTDSEWQNRIKQHQQRRPTTWQTWQLERDLVQAIASAPVSSCLLVDSLGTWVANLLEQDDTLWQETVNSLLITLQETQGQVIFVAEETGWGVIPAYPSGRLFRDRLGSLVRQVGAIANSVYLVTGGYALNLTKLGEPLSVISNQ